MTKKIEMPERKCAVCAIVFIPNPKAHWKTRCVDCIRTYHREMVHRQVLAGKAWKPSPEKSKEMYRRTKLIETPERKRRRAESMAQYRNTPEYRQRFDARAQVKNALKARRITRLACELCGADKAEAHHDDYSKPLDIRWLCHDHHNAFHREQRRLIKEGLAYAALR